MDRDESKDIQIYRGVRQGCILSPLLFNVYVDEVVKEALEELEKGMKINGKFINNIRYADDKFLIADLIEALQLILDKVSETEIRYGLSINEKKTKWMIFSRDFDLSAKIVINKKEIEKVKEFQYLGCIITENLSPEVEVKQRIVQTKTTLLKMKNILANQTLNLKSR